MAEENCSVLIQGLPTTADRACLKDKLLIHFLRKRNGGGEVTSVTLLKNVPGSALVTFEESRVALSALRHRPHILELDNKEYELSLSLANQGPQHPDEVIVSMSVTVDYSRLPRGQEVVSGVQQRFPGLRVRLAPPKDLCTIEGVYSEVQAAVTILLEPLADRRTPGSTETPALSGEDILAPGERRTQSGLEKESKVRRREERQTNLRAGHAGTAAWENSPAEVPQQEVPGQTGSGDELRLAKEHSAREKEQNDRREQMEVQNLSLIMDADVFAYLQRHSEEYRRILSGHSVHVVDMTSEGLTTLFLQPTSKGTISRRDKERLVQARRELDHLHQQQQACLRKAKLEKSALYPRGGLTAALKDVESLLPRLLVSQDDDNVYVIGESSDVSQAKQILLLSAGQSHRTSLGPTEETRRSPSHPLSPSVSPQSDTSQGDRAGPFTPALVPGLGKARGAPGAERKAEGGREYKLAARFKSSGVGGSWSRSGETGLGGESKDPSSYKEMLLPTSHCGPVLPSRTSLVNSGMPNDAGLAGISVRGLRVTGPTRTGEDILFKKSDLLSPTTSVPSLGPASKLIHGVKAPPSTTLNTISKVNNGVTTSELRTTGTVSRSSSSLTRANSFSGRARQKQDVSENCIREGLSVTKSPQRRQRSNSLSGGVSAELTVSTVMWTYMREAYRSRLDSMTSDLEVLEKGSESDEFRLVLKGIASAKVDECRRELQKLIEMVASDFCVQELRLADLGVVKGDEVFEACCSDILSRFSKVSLRFVKESVFVIGPKLLCSRVAAALKEVFPGVSAPLSQSKPHPREEVLDDRHAHKIHTKGGHVQSTSQSKKLTNQRKPETEQGEKHSIQHPSPNLKQKNSQSETEAKGHSRTVTQSKAVVEEKLEVGGAGSDTCQSHLAEASGELAGLLKDDWQPSPPISVHQNHKAAAASVKQNNMQLRDPSTALPCECVCGERGTHVIRTSCGIALCTGCLKFHSNCRTCPKEEVQTQGGQHQGPREEDKQEGGDEEVQEQGAPECGGEERRQLRGIKGTMSCTEMPLSLQGHPRDTTAKITYCIPDGIQGDEHPSPGSVFRGGVFEAYLPLSPRGRELLPCLEKALQQGYTFTVAEGDGGAKVIWDSIPHKTSMEGGKSKNGYPDFNYLNRLSEALWTHGIGVKGQERGGINQDRGRTRPAP